jgi:hypothetical protein
MRVEIENGRAIQSIVLVNNATETGWFADFCANAEYICFPSGRIRFIDKTGAPSGAPLQGQAIIYTGNNGDAFRSEFSQFGMVVYVQR